MEFEWEFIFHDASRYVTEVTTDFAEHEVFDAHGEITEKVVDEVASAAADAALRNHGFAIKSWVDFRIKVIA
jgi:hypothetical protein